MSGPKQEYPTVLHIRHPGPEGQREIMGIQEATSPTAAAVAAAGAGWVSGAEIAAIGLPYWSSALKAAKKIQRYVVKYAGNIVGWVSVELAREEGP